MLRTPCLALMTPCLASTTSCFASTTSCFASFVDVLRAFRSRSGWFLLCDARRRALLRHAKYAASDEVSQSPCFLFVFAFAPSLSLGGGPCLSMPFLVPFSQGDHRRQQEGPGLRLRAFDVPSSTCFWWRCKPSNRKILRASRRFVLPAL